MRLFIEREMSLMEKKANVLVIILCVHPSEIKMCTRICESNSDCIHALFKKGASSNYAHDQVRQ